MTKLFKNSKQVLSFVIAFAIIAVSLFVGVGINADAATANVLYYSGTPASSIANVGGGDGSSADKAIIIASAEELAYLANGAGGSTLGKYYKIADAVDAIVLQPESVAAAIMALDSADAVKTYFEANSKSVKNWVEGSSAPTTVNFDGTLDGNGVIIYGMYSKNKSYNGLLPGAHGCTIKNLGMKNNYIYGDKAALISGQSNEQGTLLIENSLFANNVILCNRKDDGIGCGGLLTGSNAGANTYSGVALTIGNSLVYDNIVTHTQYSIDYKGDKYHDKEYDINYGLGNVSDVTGFTISNSVILDTAPYSISYASNAFHKSTYTNVYTNILDMTLENIDWKNTGATELKNITISTVKEDGSVDMTYRRYENGVVNSNTEGYNRTFAAGALIKVDDESVKGSAGQTLMSGLDWENTWFATEDGPQLRVFHDLKAVTPSAKGHGYECADCDIDAVVAHIWDENTCTECGYTCNHTSQTVNDTDDATCVSKQIVYSTCNECGKELVEQVGAEPVGHNVTYVEADPADCRNTGIYGYWHCSVCDGNFVAETEEEAKWAAMDSSYANPETDLIMPADPIGGHSQKTNADGVIIIVDGANGHYYECSVCDGKLNHKSEEIAEDEVVKHDFSASVCKECGWACTEHDYQLTGNILVVGDCYTDHEDEMKCTICGKQESKVTKAAHSIVAVAEVKATDKLEGTKAHYQCENCKSIYADAEGKTSITKASLVIPKQLPAGYENTYEGTGGTTVPENADTSTKSPSTSDSVMTVAAAAAVLMGAAFVIVRKVVKA
ncbi:MAG: hypothetical protein IJY79_04260 [Clostridia bacterium]|nr:hypothetical protein [Clostridia bacterium]